MVSKTIDSIFPRAIFLSSLLLASLNGCASPHPVPKQRARAVGLDHKGAEFYRQRGLSPPFNWILDQDRPIF
jgi:hypothetical protein